MTGDERDPVASAGHTPGGAAPDDVALPAATAALISLSAALAAGDDRVLGAALDVAALRADRVGAEEVLLQSYLFLGYPAALRALAAWRERVGGPAASEAPEEERALWHERGQAVCERVYGGAYERLRENVRRLHPDIERWMLEEGYGKVLGRTGLPLRERELCIVALLAGLPAPHQLHSHLRGALNAGASPQQLEGALELAAAVLAPERIAAARALWAAVLERWRERDRTPDR